MQAGESDRPARRRVAVNEEDLDELYVLVQGAPNANTVLDAKNSLARNDLKTTVELIESARDRYSQSNKRMLRQDIGELDEKSKAAQQQARRMKQRQDRCNSVLEAFDDTISRLHRMIKLRSGGKSSPHATAALTTEELLQQGSRFRIEYETSHSTRVQLSVLRRFFRAEQVGSLQDLIVGELYFLRGKENTYLIQLRDASPGLDELPIQHALSGQPIKPIQTSRLLELGKLKHFLRLTPKADGDLDESSEIQPELENLDAPEGGTSAQQVEILDIGSFSQLHDAVIRTGMVGNVNLIAHVRDREFQRRDYQKAFQVIEGLFGKFAAAATQREQRLRKEDMDIASGKLRMSPKELMEKRARDIAESQRVDRARNRFLRVLEGLRVLMRNE